MVSVSYFEQQLHYGARCQNVSLVSKTNKVFILQQSPMDTAEGIKRFVITILCDSAF